MSSAQHGTQAQQEFATGRRDRHAILINEAAAQVRAFDDALQTSPGKWRPPDRQPGVWVEDDEIGVKADVDGAFAVEAGEARGREAHPLRQLIERVSARTRFGPRHREVELNR
jgi:hypothetical protein